MAAKKLAAKKKAAARSSADRPPKPTRQERIDAQRRTRRRRELRNRITMWGLALAVVAVVAVVVINNRRQSDRLTAQLEAGSCDFDRDANSGSEHVEGATYTIEPPSGGDHDAAATPAGTYAGAQMPEDVNLVHSLEHGFVILWHRPDITEDQRRQLGTIREPYSKDVLIVERATLPVPVAAVAWHKRLLCPEIEVEALERFVEEFRNDGPEDVPH